MKKYLILIFILISTAAISQSVQRISLNDGWEFRQVGTEKWYPAQVPGCVHTDLYRNGLIPDPYSGSSEKELQWIETKDWEFRKIFNLDEKFLNVYSKQITFEGLDTYAEIYLNSEFLYKTGNMFSKYEFDNLNLNKSSNELKIIFRSPVITADSIANAYYISNGIKGLPGGSQVFTRKAAYQYGWDFAPRYVTCGIWRDVYLEGWEKLKIDYIRPIIRYIQNDKARIDVNFNLKIQPEEGKKLRTFLITDENEKIVYDSMSNYFEMSEFYSVRDNYKWNFSFDIDNPKLWWCNGLGEPYLYTFKFIIKYEGKKIDEKVFKTGIRKIELIQDIDEHGKSFYFELNDIPVFIKGANYVPADVFPSQITKDKYKNLITSAKQTNMNMLRVWGGGIYENDYFYDLCDSLGIMVWQDFMFACGMYPEGINIKKEVKENFNRLVGHPCIALWCGNNEIDEGWKNWGWQKEFGYTGQDSMKIWEDYSKLFEKEIPSDLFIWHNYIPTSPKIGWGHPEAMKKGDSHYWGVWWGEEPFEAYKTKVPRFMSEYGFQSLPDINTIESFTQPEDRYLNSEAMKSHQKNPKGFQLINEYMERDFDVPADFEEYIQTSQKLQTYGYKMAIEAHRRAKPRCMGTLYWQLNDCWPAVSWSSIDYYGRWKDIMYKLKDLYADILISPVVENDSLKIYIVSDRFENLNGNVFLELINDVTGDTLWTSDFEVSLPENSSAVYFITALNSVLKNYENDELYLSCRYVNAGDNNTYSNKLIFVKPKYFKGKSL